MTTDFVHFPPKPVRDTPALAEIHIDPSPHAKPIYTVILVGGRDDRPIMRGERVLFFTPPDRANEAIASADNYLPGELASEQVEAIPEIVVDIAEALHIANGEDVDEDEILHECLALLDDLVRATKLNVPADYMSVLSALAERLGEGREFGTWVRENGIDRERVEDGIMWCVGAVVVKSTMLADVS